MSGYIEPNTIVQSDSRDALRRITPNSVACSIWSPPYHVGKEYEDGVSYQE